jgi:hypothetical protein
MQKGFIASALVIIVIAFWMSVPVGCANIVPPEGGPRDTIPPVLVSATPRDSSVNFRSQHIVLTFNEDIDDPRNPNDIIYTPSMDIPPTITTKGKAMTVKFNDSLEPNTTYVINFGDQVIDITEANPLRNFVYTFSTGPYLDSLEISGKVILAENGGIDTTLNVALYKDRSDSAIRLKNPMYVVRLDRNGNFRFHNLPKDTFAIYAFGGSARRYNNRELFAFYDTSIVAGEADSVVLYAYRETPTTSTTTPGVTIQRIPSSDRRLRFTPGTTTQQELLDDYKLTFQVPLRNFDSTKIHLSTDSVFAPANFTATLDTTRKEVRIKTEWKEGTQYHLILEKEFATDTTGRQLLKTDTLSFTTKRKADYGAITSLRFRNLDKYKHPVVQFVLNNQVVKSVPIKGPIYSEAPVTPGEYYLRVFDDVNQNGKWDTGQFFGGKRQPEIIHPLERPFTIKANWDNEFEVVL